jgi:tetratricopeptide (TPR) repeat protein/transcriptional regulator with XRE-family HTH domain
MAGKSTGDARTFGDQLKQYRRAAGLTQEMLAERAGYSTVYVSMLERGQRLPLVATADALADALELTAWDRTALRAACRPEGTTSDSESLVGRTRELQALKRHLAGEGAPVLLLEGEPGIGKTRLLREVEVKAAAERLRVLSGGCLRRGGQQPYAPLLEAIQGYIGGQEETQLRRDLAGCAWLVRLLPELYGGPIEPLPAWTLQPEQEQRLMNEAVARFLANIGGPAGTLLVLDDLQWAGTDALDLLAMLARPAGRVPLRIVGAYRDTEIHRRHPLSTFLADLGHAGLVTHLALKPLAGSDAAVLLDRLLGDEGANPVVREQVVRRADGVPFFLVSCALALRAGAGGGGRGDIPWDVSHSIRQRVGMLGEEAQDVLSVLAIGNNLPPGLLAAVTGEPEAEVLDVLEASQGARLVEEEGDGTYRFAHAVIREVVESDLSAARRTLLHRRIAEELERVPPAGARGRLPVERLAFHYARSSDGEKALFYLEQAGDAARARYANATAEGYYRELVDRLDDLERPGEAAAAREKLGAVLTTMARYDAALSVLEEAAQVYASSGERNGEGRAVAQIGRVHYLRGTTDDGIRRLLPLRDRAVQEGLPATVGAVDVALAPLFLARGRYTEQLEAAEGAAAAARAIGSDRLLAEAEVWRGCALNQLGEMIEGRQVQEAAVPLAEAASDLASLSHALNDVAFSYERSGEFATSRGYKERALGIAERVGDPASIANLTFRCGQNAFLAGEWPRAQEYFERATEIAREIGSSSILAYPLFGMGMLALVQGDWAEAATYAEECAEVAERSGDQQAARAAAGLLAELDLLGGSPPVARARLAHLAPDEEGLTLHSILPVLAEACLPDAVEEARRWAERSIAQAEAHGNRVVLVDGLRVRGMVAATQREGGEASRWFEEALEVTRLMGYRYGEGRVLESYGQSMAGQGNWERARGMLAEAVEVLEGLGARSYAERAKRVLGRVTAEAV